MEDLSNLEEVLKQHTNDRGVSLFQHMQFVMNQIKNNPLKVIKDQYKDFETTSNFARKQFFNYTSPLDEGKHY